MLSGATERIGAATPFTLTVTLPNILDKGVPGDATYDTSLSPAPDSVIAEPGAIAPERSTAAARKTAPEICPPLKSILTSLPSPDTYHATCPSSDIVYCLTPLGSLALVNSWNPVPSRLIA